MTRRFAWASLAALCVAGAASAQVGVIDARPLPLATKRITASSDECAVWRREQAFARSVEAHDARAFGSFLHAGTVFNAGTADADRGSDEVAKSWAEIVEGRPIALRWRPGIVQPSPGSGSHVAVEGHCIVGVVAYLLPHKLGLIMATILGIAAGMIVSAYMHTEGEE